MKAKNKKGAKKKDASSRRTVKKTTRKSSTSSTRKVRKSTTTKGGEKKLRARKRKTSPKKTPKSVASVRSRTSRKKGKLRKEELARLKAELFSEREHILKELENLDEITRSNGYEGRNQIHGYSNHMAEFAAENEAINTALGLRKLAIERLNQVTNALERLANGNYGICQRCGRAIQMERLLAKPQALLCVECKRAVEAEQRGQL